MFTRPRADWRSGRGAVAGTVFARFPPLTGAIYLFNPATPPAPSLYVYSLTVDPGEGSTAWSGGFVRGKAGALVADGVAAIAPEAGAPPAELYALNDTGFSQSSMLSCLRPLPRTLAMGGVPFFVITPGYSLRLIGSILCNSLSVELSFYWE